MNVNDDEPRKVPKPVSFCQDPLINPAVPEVSLIFRETDTSTSPAKNDSFSGTEFQTYNAWRWQNINKKPTKQNDSFPECLNSFDCCIIKDKYYTTDVERRKNEILYGQLDEPRKPLSPRPSPVIPNCMTTSFPDASFSSAQWRDENALITIKKQEKTNRHDMEDLYKIISEQNKKLMQLQKQIEQLLQSQEKKEKHIEHLLASHEKKEQQLEQLLKSQEAKENQIEQLHKAQGTRERQIEQLLKSQEKKERQIEQLMTVVEKQKEELLKQIKEKKVYASIGVMAVVDKVEASTNTAFDMTCKNCHGKDNGRRNDREGTINETIRDRSFTLNSIDLPTMQEHVPTPQSSIHVDIQDFKDSSEDESDDSCDVTSRSKAFVTPINSDANPLGYTFYNNLLTQVKDILENSNDKEKKEDEETNDNKEGRATEKRSLREYNHVHEEQECQSPKPDLPNADNSHRNRLQQFQAWKLNVVGRENVLPSYEDRRMVQLDAVDRLHCDYAGVKDVQSPSDISLKMNALAMKYLKQEQLSQYNILPQNQQTTARQPDVTIYNVTNLSFGTMRYLERHRIQPNGKVEQLKDRAHSEDVCSPRKLLQRKKKLALCNDYNTSDVYRQ